MRWPWIDRAWAEEWKAQADWATKQLREAEAASLKATIALIGCEAAVKQLEARLEASEAERTQLQRALIDVAKAMAPDEHERVTEPMGAEEARTQPKPVDTPPPPPVRVLSAFEVASRATNFRNKQHREAGK